MRSALARGGRCLQPLGQAGRAIVVARAINLRAARQWPLGADHVGSLLRPKHLLEARDKLDKGQIASTALRRFGLRRP